MATGDLNGDGLLDLVVGSGQPGMGFDVYLGLSSGGLGAPTHYPGAGGAALALGDVDRDGTLDVLASTGDGQQDSLNAFLNDGTGSLTGPRNSATATAVTISSLGIGDFNKDGMPDVAVAETSGTAEILFGNGTGFFETRVPISGSGTPAGGLVVADLNQDGLPDVVMNAAPGDNLNVFINDGDGGFVVTPYPTPACAQIVALVGSQGVVDLVVATLAGLRVLHNSGKGVFALGGLYSGLTPRPCGWTNLTVGDFNGDCIPDIVASSFSNCVDDGPHLAVYYGTQNGEFASPVHLQPEGNAPGSMALLGSISSPRALVVADGCAPGLEVYGDPGKH
jgi:hypothetical protein